MLSRLLFIFLFVGASFIAAAFTTDSVQIKGQLTGNCAITEIKLKEFSISGDVSFSTPVSSFGSFSFTAVIKGIKQITLSAGRLRYDFLVTPNQRVYRFDITCRPDGNFNVKLEDSRENEAFELLTKIEKQLVVSCADIVERYRSPDSSRFFLQQSFIAHNYNLQQIEHAYPGTVTADLLAPSCSIADSVPGKTFAETIVQSTLLNPAWNNNAIYNTDLPLSFISLVRGLVKKTDGQAHENLLQTILASAKFKEEALQNFQFMLYEYLFYKLDERMIHVFGEWAGQHPDRIVNPVLKAKLINIKNVLPPAPFIEVVLSDTSGREAKLSETVKKNKSTVLVFWSPQCSHCIAEMPALKSFYKKFHSKKVEIYAVAMDCTIEQWKQFIQQNKLTWINVRMDETAEPNPVVQYQLSYTPTMVLIGKDGHIESRFGSLEKIEALLMTAPKK